MDISRLQTHADAAARLLRLLGNSRRLALICLLRDGDKSVGALARSLHITQSSVSQHLALLRKAGLVKHRREGTTVFYKLDAQLVSPLLRTVLPAGAP